LGRGGGGQANFRGFDPSFGGRKRPVTPPSRGCGVGEVPFRRLFHCAPAARNSRQRLGGEGFGFRGSRAGLGRSDIRLLAWGRAFSKTVSTRTLPVSHPFGRETRNGWGTSVSGSLAPRYPRRVAESPRRLFGVAPIKLIRRKFMTPRRLSGMALRLHTILLGISTAAASPERAYRDSEERRHGCLRNRQFTQFSRHAV
jgi:hypothetical protein